MNSRITAIVVLIALMVIAGAQLEHYYPQLPDKIATHFGGSGQPDGWNAKSTFVWINAILLGSLSLVFVAIAWLVPKLPASLINIPHKDYWLAAERKQQTMESFAVQILWMNNATLAFLVLLFHLIIRTNLNGAPRLGAAFWISFAGFMIFVIVWAVALYLRYLNLPNRSS